jgi:hypothetical protein
VTPPSPVTPAVDLDDRALEPQVPGGLAVEVDRGAGEVEVGPGLVVGGVDPRGVDAVFGARDLARARGLGARGGVVVAVVLGRGGIEGRVFDAPGAAGEDQRERSQERMFTSETEKGAGWPPPA